MRTAIPMPVPAIHSRTSPPVRLFAALALILASLLPACSGKEPPLLPPAVSERKIGLLHMHDGAPFFAKLGSITLSNKRRYAARHGYELVSHTPQGTSGLWRAADLPAGASCNGSGLATRGDGGCYARADEGFAIDQRAATFGKIKLALAACAGRDGYWLLWSDADALVVNQSVALESVIDDGFDVVVSRDWLMMNAGVMLLKCSGWTRGFLGRVYAAREFDGARALDQSALQHFMDEEKGARERVKFVPKHVINVYVEEYRPGDFLLHMAGKLYEATTEGAIALAQQFDVLSGVEDLEDVEAFFRGQYVLNMYSGVCLDAEGRDSDCKPTDERRLRLKEALGAMSSPKRYRHVGLRYYWMPDWKDEEDKEGWNEGRKMFDGGKESGRCGREDGDKCRDEEAREVHEEL